MPVNGVAVALPVEPAETKPGAAPDSTPMGIEHAIGAAMADATETLAAAMADLDAGGLTAANRTRGGETIAALVELQLAALGAMPDFGAVALAEGRRTLITRHGVTLRQRLGSDAGIDAVFSELLSHILAVAAQVVATERVFREH
jgi:hypothetical protein